jgi:hypothetical protein
MEIDSEKAIVKPEDIERMYLENKRLKAQLKQERKIRERTELILEQTKNQYTKLEKETRLHKAVFELAEDAFINNHISPEDHGYMGAIARILAQVP